MGLSLEPVATNDLRFVVAGAYVADCLVETDVLPTWGSTVKARSIRTSPGGKALNQALMIARHGATVTALGVLGDDAQGKEILAGLSREGVEVGRIQVRKDVPTPVCVCFAGNQGDTSFVWRIHDMAAVTPDVIRAADADIASAHVILITFELPVLTICDLLDTARYHGAKVVAQPAPSLDRDQDISIIPWRKIDVLVPNEAEARSLVNRLDTRKQDSPPADLAESLATALDIPAVVVTLGSAGCVLYTREHGCHHYDAVPTHVVDSTGASDAFTATLAFNLATGSAIHEAINGAMSVAASSISRVGSSESMSQYRDGDQRLTGHGP